MPIFLPDECMRGLKTCKPLALIESDPEVFGGELSFFCCGENDGSTRSVKQDKYTICFKNCDLDICHDNDKRDLTHQMAVIAQALAIIEEEDSSDYHLPP